MNGHQTSSVHVERSSSAVENVVETGVPFLLELLSEEIPARMQEKAAKDLAFLLAAALQKAGLAYGDVRGFATPRRLAVIVRDLPLQTQPQSEEIKGPRADAPPQALAGFLGKTGLTRDQLVARTDAKGQAVLYAVIEKPGRATADVLAEAIPAIVRGFPWPKSMRWGTASSSTASLRWVRPLKGIVALLGEDIVEVEIAGIASGAATVGHRFHHPGAITIGSADDYEAKLRACHVILDPAERQATIRDTAARIAADAGLSVMPDEGLVAENAGLTEWPVPLLGGFDPAFLDLPREVIQLTMRTNQKYFACVDASGALAPNFLCTANIQPTDGGAAIVAGNARVLAARLSDARFFWDQDIRVPLEAQADKLGQIVFHEKLGTVADKVARVAKLARWLVEEGVIAPSPPRGEGWGGGPGATTLPSSPQHQDQPPTPTLPPEGGGSTDVPTLADMAGTAARLCKADLVTGMVGEFPELQGVIGGYYARAQGHPDAVADAIRDHYKPVGQGDDVPTAPVTVAVSLADKLDTIVSFFAINEKPTGSKDPFALRRAAISITRMLTFNNIKVSLKVMIYQSEEYLGIQRINNTVLGYESSAKEALSILGRTDGIKSIAEEYKSQRVFRDAFNESFLRQSDILAFLIDRLKVQQKEAGVRHDLIDAVFALGGEDDLVRLLARVHALQAFVETADGRDLLAGYKRAANILKKEGPPPAVDPHERLSYTPEKEEAALIAVLDAAAPAAAHAVADERFAAAMVALSSLRGPIDAFFEHVTVNDADPARRTARLALLGRIRDAVHGVADFSRIEG